MNPKISLVIPCYNGEQFLDWTLRSVVAQVGADFECIVVNDGSTDSSADIILDYVRSDPRIRTIAHRANSGLSASRNTGLRAARGRYVAFLDADDLLMPDSLALRASALDQATEEACIGTYCASKTIEEGQAEPPKTEPFPSLRLVDFLTSAGQCPFNANQPMLKRDLLLQMGGFDERLKQAEDYDLWSRILRAGYYFVPTKAQAVTYRSRSESMIRTGPLAHLKISMALSELAHQSLPLECAYAGSTGFLEKPIHEYKHQVDIAQRTLSFSGMALAAGESPAYVADFAHLYLPDIFGFVGRHRSVRECLYNGVKRQIGFDPRASDAPLATQNRYELLVSRFLSLLEGRVVEAQAQDLGRTVEALPKAAADHVKSSTVWRPDVQRKVEVVFLPHKNYHVWTISLLQSALADAGINFTTVDISGHYRDEGVRRAAAEYGVELTRYGNFVLGDYQPKLLISFNDWDPIVRSIFEAAESVGVRTAAIVEGVQDYADADTRQRRRAYQHANHVFLPGDYDRRYFADASKVEVLGIPRVHQLRKMPKAAATGNTALINSNFSYGVLTDARDEWIVSAVNAARAAGLDPVITRHPADQGRCHSDLVTDLDFYSALDRAAVVIQRFGSGVIEAAARGVPTAYFNPHGEKVDKFQYDGSPIKILRTEAELLTFLQDRSTWALDAATENAFLDLHAGPEDDGLAARFAASVRQILATVEEHQPIRSALVGLDQTSAAFHELVALRARYEEPTSSECVGSPEPSSEPYPSDGDDTVADEDAWNGVPVDVKIALRRHGVDLPGLVEEASEAKSIPRHLGLAAGLQADSHIGESAANAYLTGRAGNAQPSQGFVGMAAVSAALWGGAFWHHLGVVLHSLGEWRASTAALNECSEAGTATHFTNWFLLRSALLANDGESAKRALASLAGAPDTARFRIQALIAQAALGDGPVPVAEVARLAGLKDMWVARSRELASSLAQRAKAHGDSATANNLKSIAEALT